VGPADGPEALQPTTLAVFGRPTRGTFGPNSLMQRTDPSLTRRRAAVAIATALVLGCVLGLTLGTGQRTAGALPAQLPPFTTRLRTTTVPTGPRTTERPEEPPPTRRPRTTEEEAPEPTRPPVTTAKPATTRKAVPATTSAAASVTTPLPTMPPSTTVPELLVAGPVIVEGATAQEGKSDGVSASAALRWVIIGLIVVGLAIAGLTVAYWRHTRPRRPEPWESPEGEEDGGSPGGGAAAWNSNDPYEIYRPPPAQPGYGGQPTYGDPSGPVDPSRIGHPGQPGQSTWAPQRGGTSMFDRPAGVPVGEAYDRPWGS
jgi:hypothetical protein